MINSPMKGVQALVNGVSSGIFFGVTKVIILAGDGNDMVTGATQLPVWAFGQGGNDTIVGGVGDDLLAGGSGDDDLNGGAGRDVLIGGTGSNRLQGAGGNDVVIAGGANYDASGPSDFMTLCRVVDDLLRSDLDPAHRF